MINFYKLPIINENNYSLGKNSLNFSAVTWQLTEHSTCFILLIPYAQNEGLTMKTTWTAFLINH